MSHTTLDNWMDGWMDPSAARGGASALASGLAAADFGEQGCRVSHDQADSLSLSLSSSVSTCPATYGDRYRSLFGLSRQMNNDIKRDETRSAARLINECGSPLAVLPMSSHVVSVHVCARVCGTRHRSRETARSKTARSKPDPGATLFSYPAYVAGDDESA